MFCVCVCICMHRYVYVKTNIFIYDIYNMYNIYTGKCTVNVSILVMIKYCPEGVVLLLFGPVKAC